ncbi:MAG: hypothetical protein VX210_15420 [Myxococcota bacterium]|nr:hypothetical protein [Myxococcota bacterium]
MEQMIDAIQTNPALGLALVLLAFALILSIVKKLVKLAALVLLVLGGLGYFLQSQETTLPEALERANDELRDAADDIGDVTDGMKERLKATQKAVETIRENLPDADQAAEMVEALEEPAKVVGEALQNTASGVAETTKKLPTTLKDIMPGLKSTKKSDEEKSPEELKKEKVKNQMLDMVKKRSSLIKERIKNAAESTKTE